MMTTIKHSKFRNTGILFELLSRQIAVDVLNNNNSKSIIILKKYFNENTTLGKESRLYQTLINEKFNSETKATHFLDNVIKNRQKLVNSVLRREKYNLIKEIKETFNIEDFFKSRIPNYKVIASIYKLFEQQENLSPEEKTESYFNLMENITSKETIKLSETTDIKLPDDEDLRTITYRVLLEKFNQKYSHLNGSQKKLLRTYINNISNTNSLKEYIEKQVPIIRKELKRYEKKVDDKITKIKLNEAINSIGKFCIAKHTKVAKDSTVIQMMRYYELIKELKKA